MNEERAIKALQNIIDYWTYMPKWRPSIHMPTEVEAAKMAIEALEKQILIKRMRSCVVDNKYKALFHRWEDKSDVIAPSMSIGGAPGGQITRTLAIVEYEDGTIHEAYPHEIRFTDREG